MIDCDVLVMSRSSLSACAAYLKNTGGIAIYHPFWHQMLPVEDGHIPCKGPDGQDSHGLLDKHIEDYVERFRDQNVTARRKD